MSKALAKNRPGVCLLRIHLCDVSKIYFSTSKTTEMTTKIQFSLGIILLFLFFQFSPAQEVDPQQMREEATNALQQLFDLNVDPDRGRMTSPEEVLEWIERNFENAEEREMLRHDFEKLRASGAVAMKFPDVNVNCGHIPDMFYMRVPTGNRPPDGMSGGYIFHGLCGKDEGKEPDWCENCTPCIAEDGGVCVCTKSTKVCRACPPDCI